MSRNVYVELDYFSGKKSTRIFSIKPDPSNDAEGRLMRPLKFSIKVRTWIQNESTTSGISKIIINNADGALDDFANETFTECRIKQAVDGVFTTLATAQVDRVIINGLKFIEVNLKDARSLLEIPLQDDFFPASETSDVGLGMNTYYALEGQPRPLTIGRAYSVRPVLAKRSNNEYHVHDSKADDIREVYDNGIVVSKNEHTKGFTLSVDPAGLIVADVNGAEIVGGTAVAWRLWEAIQWVFDKRGITNYLLSDLTDIYADKARLIGYYQDNSTNISVRELIKRICDSFTGWFYADESGNIRFGYLDEPKVVADKSINKNNVIDGIKVFDDLAPNITTKIGSDRNWYVYDVDQIAAGATDQNRTNLSQQWRAVLDGTGVLDEFYTSTEQVYDSILIDPPRAQLEINAITSLYSQRRKFYTFQSTLDAEIGETVQLTHPRFSLDAGVNLLCVGREIDFIDNTYRLTLWG